MMLSFHTTFYMCLIKFEEFSPFEIYANKNEKYKLQLEPSFQTKFYTNSVYKVV